MEEIKKNPEENNEFKVLWNGEEIEVYLDYYDFEKEVDEVREKLENLKILVENAKEWDKKIKDAAGEDLFEIIEDDNWPRSDFEEEDIPNLINDIENTFEKEETTGVSRWDISKNYFKIGTNMYIYPVNNLKIGYHLLIPVSLKGLDIDGFFIRNGLSLGFVF